MVAVQIDIGTRRIEEIDTEYAVTLMFSGGVQIRIEGSFTISGTGRAPTTFDPQNLGTDQGLHRVIGGGTVEFATADENSGSLVVTLSGGIILRVAADPDFESWTASWPDGNTVVSMPGGGLSCWGPRP
ncbi:DUF6188 family protein [Aeromicrobium yanjiei]|uniref:DUF6188 family protein n=1 Tax=Aeromicrobium yanjiei TaxID=2662028 RepID=UPI003C7D899B